MSYEPIIEKIVKEMEFRKWVEQKKQVLKNENKKDNLDDIMEAGIKSTASYLEKE